MHKPALIRIDTWTFQRMRTGKTGNAKSDMIEITAMNVRKERRSREQRRPTRLGDDDPLELCVCETLPFDFGIPSRVNRPALDNPQYGQDDIAHNQDSYRCLDRSDDMCLDRNAQKKEADRNLGEHERLKRLDPLSVGIFLELDGFPCRKIKLVSPKPVVDFDNH